MLQIKYLIVVFLGLASVLSHAQEASKRDLLIQTVDSGSYAIKLEDLVNASDVIVRGHYGARESMERDYGGETLESIMNKTGKTAEEAALHGIPVANHEIVIDEIIKGNEILFNSAVLTVQMAESEDAYEVFEWLADSREGEHLLFLQHHPEKDIYSIRGNMFDMKKIGGAYYYRLSRLLANDAMLEQPIAKAYGVSSGN